MATSALPTVITTLVSSFKAASSLNGTTIYDGLEMDRQYSGDWIAVGHDGATDADEVNAGSARQKYGPIGAKSKIENGSVNCCLLAQSGATNMATLRTTAFNLLGDVETIIRNDPSLGSIVQWADLDQFQASYIESPAGGGVQISFTITYELKI